MLEVPITKRYKNGGDEETKAPQSKLSDFKEDSSLPGCLSLGELAGRLPSSLLINIDFNKFAALNGLQSLD